MFCRYDVIIIIIYLIMFQIRLVTILSTGCPEPDIPTNGRVNTSEGVAVGHTIYYSCVDGYELVGQGERICEASSEWSGDPPVCLISTSINTCEFSFVRFCIF